MDERRRPQARPGASTPPCPRLTQPVPASGWHSLCLLLLLLHPHTCPLTHLHRNVQAFDASRASPALAALLQRGELQVAGKRVFVPGCGRGYDVQLFASHGAEAVVGLELAPTAAAEARQYLESQLAGEAAARAAVHQGDFFTWKHEQHAAFQAGFDYTFFCALHPEMRGDWAAAWARHLAPGGTLVCLAFPIDPERKGVPGPPWYVEPAHYDEHLTPHGASACLCRALGCVCPRCIERCRATRSRSGACPHPRTPPPTPTPAGFTLERHEPVPPELSHAGREGKEALLIYRRA